MLDVAARGEERVDLSGVDVQAENVSAGARELKGKRETHVSETDDGYLHKARGSLTKGPGGMGKF